MQKLSVHSTMETLKLQSQSIMQNKFIKGMNRWELRGSLICSGFTFFLSRTQWIFSSFWWGLSEQKNVAKQGVIHE